MELAIKILILILASKKNLLSIIFCKDWSIKFYYKKVSYVIANPLASLVSIENMYTTTQRAPTTTPSYTTTPNFGF